MVLWCGHGSEAPWYSLPQVLDNDLLEFVSLAQTPRLAYRGGVIIIWIAFLVLIVALLALDLGVFHKEIRVLGLREASLWTAFWITLGLAFSGVVYLIYSNAWGGASIDVAPGATFSSPGAQATVLYITAYLLEKSLSIDNIFVIVMIFDGFKVYPEVRHRVLYWGILGALIARGAMILGGIWLLTRFTWLFYVFGAYLIWAGIGILREDSEDEADPENKLIVRIARRVLPITQEMHGERFTVIENGKRMFTPLLIVLLVIEATDVLFALDSIPAVLAVTTDSFIVFTSNVFAILGLRSLYFVLEGMMERFHYLKLALAAILGFIGLKMILHGVFHVPNLVSLGVIVLAITVGIIASLRATRPRAL